MLALVFGVIERRWPSVERHHARRLHPRRGTWTDLVYWIVGPAMSQVISAIAIVLIAIAAGLVLGTPLGTESLHAIAQRAAWFAEQPYALQVVLVFAVGDFVGYWIHRAFHRGRWWRFHAIHHSSRDLDWLASVRVHPVNDLVQRVLQALVVLGLGFDPRVVSAFVPFVALYAIALHANVRWTFGPLRYVIASPTFHRWHHTSEDAGLDKNFAGLFPIWDLLFGTFYLPANQVPQTFGVRDPVPEGFLGQLVWPFRRR